MLFDAHNHLHFISGENEPESAIQRARAVGVFAMACCATGASARDWDLVRSLGERHQDVLKVSFGLHPWYVDSPPLDWKRSLEHIADKMACGIGEVGLDRSARCPAPVEAQLNALNWQLDLAQERGLPVTLHCTGAWELIYKVLKGRPSLRHMLHGYHGSPEMTRELAGLGTFFSLGPSSVSPRRRPIAATFAAIPPERFLLETDAPDGRMPPKDKKPVKCEPADMPELRDTLAKTLEKPAGELEEQSFRNALAFFGPFPE